MNFWQKQLNNDIDKILFDEQTIAARIKELAQQITSDYEDMEDDLIIIGVLRGSVLFMSDLIREIQLPVSLDFISMSSYTKGTKTSGTVHILKDISENINGRHVLIVEDIIDTGLTLKTLAEMLQVRNPKSLKICTLLDKPSRRRVELSPDYFGFSIPDEFVVGYGLDYNDSYRHLPFIGVLKPELYE